MAAKATVPADNWVEVFYEDLFSNVQETPYDAFGEIRLNKWKGGRNREKIERMMTQVEPIARAMGYVP